MLRHLAGTVYAEPDPATYAAAHEIRRVECTERSRCRVDLVVKGTVRERAQLIDEGFVPGALDQLDEAVLALRTQRIGAGLLVADLYFGVDRPAG